MLQKIFTMLKEEYLSNARNNIIENNYSEVISIDKKY